MRRYRLPYWAFVPTLGVWPGVTGTGSETGPAVSAATIPPPTRGSVAVNLDSGRVTVVDDVADRSEVGDAATDQNRKRRPVQVKPMHSNTPSVGGPSWLRKTVVPAASSDPVKQASQVKNSTAVATEKPVTKIYLKPSARAKAGVGGVALSNPISTAVVRRGDTVSIEYLPDATAEAGEGGVAISRPELVIHFID